MDFEFTEEQAMLQKNVRAFLEKEIAPLVNEYEQKYTPFPREILVDLIKKLLPWDYCLGIMKKEDGGTEIPYITNGLLQEELSRVWPVTGFWWWLSGCKAGNRGAKEKVFTGITVS